jgi:molecular chaperone DnaJ
MTSNEDLYVILEVGRTASINEIKRAFRKLARKFHPDINPGDRQAEERFKRITEAYQVLSDPFKRQFYDVNGFYTEGVLEEHSRKDATWGFSFQGFDFSRSSQSPYNEIFGQIFAQHAIRREAEPGQDLEHPLSTSFEEALRGVRTRVTVFRKIQCANCSGSGRAPGSRESACAVCGGVGKTVKSKGHLQFAVSCAECGGTGRTISKCAECRGEGRLSGTESLVIDLPAGVTTGSRIRFPGKGEAGRFGGPAGDLYIVVNTTEHPFFTRVGDNIHCTVPVTVTEAALGSKIEVPTIDGRAIVRIPPGTQTGQKFRLRGRGAPSLLHPGMRGDQYVEAKIVVPRIADERSKEILRELSKLNPQDPREDIWR